MLPTVLRNLHDFSSLGWRDLMTVSEHCRLLTIPSGRNVVTPSRKLPGSYFLLRGRLRVSPPELILKHSSPRARHAIYPGFSRVVTHSAVQLLHIDMRPLAFLLGEGANLLMSLEDDEGLDGWEDRFLNTPVMQNLEPAAWQKVLQAMTERRYPSGADVIRQGDGRDGFYVLKTGSAEVHRAGQTLALLQNGDFFGEDALIAGQPRNATVTMLEEGSVMHLPVALFLDLLLQKALTRSSDIYRRTRVSVTGQIDALHLHMDGLREQLVDLDRDTPYVIVDGAWPVRALSAFIMTQRGFDVCVLEKPKPDQAGTVRSAAQVRRA